MNKLKYSELFTLRSIVYILIGINNIEHIAVIKKNNDLNHILSLSDFNSNI